ncbi:GAF domain-containing sensor histidine kinase [Streptoalloteichus hindustanus]|uniref:Two-component system, LytT family, sensor kinase n=1 Tax=Streptoalloteichus hindustanus TaxID=2017 RepID=A0A1M4VAY7_STRHI|nr:histidine kinase [Streptoalloteichus hindustanus]SHE66136.1 two-component system, LytT family, sensor kinase [Streptoalloteichus hindustanus]
MRELLIEQTTPTLLATVAVLGLFLMLCRARRVSTSVENATLDALHRVSRAAPALQDGLTVSTAEAAAPHLRELLACVAVALSDDQGQLLAWDGEANHHYADLTESFVKVLATGKRELIDHTELGCEIPRCPMRHAVVVPLLVEGRPTGALTIVASTNGKRLWRAAEEAGAYVSIQLSLAEFQESRAQLAMAEVKALRAQISPHFLYNALTTIGSLVRTDPQQARELLLDFADFTRYSFRTAGEYTTLADELHNIERYLTLEQARFGEDRLRIELQISPEVLPVSLPFLALQPLVENAVRHGLASKREGGTIKVVAADAGAEAVISVDDDGVGMDPDRLREELSDAHLTGAHVGLGNINARLMSAFGKDYGLIVETNFGAGTKVIMRVPKFRPGVHAQPPAWQILEDGDDRYDPFGDYRERSGAAFDDAELPVPAQPKLRVVASPEQSRVGSP